MFPPASSRGGRSSSQSSALQMRSQNTATSMGSTSTSTGNGTTGSSSFQQRLQNIQNSAAAAKVETGDLAYNNGGLVGAANFSVDPVTHNLIVVADKQTEEQIREAIAKLDEPSRQMLIGGAVMDVSLTNSSVAGKLDTGLTKDDVSGLRMLLTTNQSQSEDRAAPKSSLTAPIPQPEILTRENTFSTFSINVSDVSFKLAEASLQNGRMPDAASIRSEEFINAFDYRDPEAAAGQPVAFASERAQYPFAQNRDLLRFSIKTAAAGRAADRPLNLVLLLDTSGSMERADRVAIIREAMRVLAAQLHPQDTVSVVTFARTARLWADGVPGDKAGETLDRKSAASRRKAARISKRPCGSPTKRRGGITSPME